MIYSLPISKARRVRVILNIFDHMTPFSMMTSRDRDVLAEYVNKYYELKGTMTKDEIDAILFTKAFTIKIAEKLDMPVESVRNYLTRLRGKKIMIGRTLSPNIKALFDNMKNEVTFKLDLK